MKKCVIWKNKKTATDVSAHLRPFNIGNKLFNAESLKYLMLLHNVTTPAPHPQPGQNFLTHVY